MDRKTFIRYAFPNKTGVDKSKLMLDEVESYFSMTNARDAEIISNCLYNLAKKFNPNPVIADMTAHVGGNSISFAYHFHHVISNELNKSTFEMLKNNMNIYKLKNVTCLNENAIDIIPKLTEKVTVTFFDPPWGGKNYKESKQIDLIVGNKKVVDLISSCPSKIVAIKAPFNAKIIGYTRVLYLKKYLVYIFVK
jgi:tRNA/tmRNA/rRNA uracil-C5-methylase (TrmA/RlmC/RlmD family)